MTQDLSHFHEPMSDFLGPSNAEDGMEKLRLTVDQLAFFREQGYLTGIRILSDRQIDILRRELAGFSQPDHPGFELWYEYHTNESRDPATVLFHALGAWRITPGFHDLLWHPAFTIPASQLLEGAVRFWHDQLFWKPAYHGGVVSWHQDYSYWTRTQPLGHLTCWIALDDSSRENGCLHYVPGSHYWELLPITGLAGDMAAIREVLDDDQWRALQNPVAIEVKAGECAFHHPLLVHGSFENRTDRPRRATVINVVRDGVASGSDLPLLAGVPPIRQGQQLAGQFFPLLHGATHPV